MGEVARASFMCACVCVLFVCVCVRACVRACVGYGCKVTGSREHCSGFGV